MGGKSGGRWGEVEGLGRGGGDGTHGKRGNEKQKNGKNPNVQPKNHAMIGA